MTNTAPVTHGVFRRAAGAAGELLAVVGIGFTLPFVIIAIGIPIALLLRLLLWAGGLL